MKKRINLFRVKKQRDARYIFLQKIQILSTVIGIIFFVFFLILVSMQFKFNQQIKDLNSNKQKMLTYILENKDIEAKIRYFKNKQNQLNNYLKDDANFVPYYSLLKNAVYSSSESAIIQSILIDKNRNTEFFIKFSDQLAMINFLNYIESEHFLRNFTELSLRNFTLREKALLETQKNYQLTFKGKFKEIKE